MLKTCEPWPSRISSGGPQIVRSIQGYMEVCDECGRRYRRMATATRPAKVLCGKCYPSPDDLVNSADSCQIVGNREALQRSD